VTCSDKFDLKSNKPDRGMKVVLALLISGMVDVILDFILVWSIPIPGFSLLWCLLKLKIKENHIIPMHLVRLLDLKNQRVSYFGYCSLSRSGFRPYDLLQDSDNLRTLTDIVCPES